jgi:hypothetical protein
MFFFTFNQGTNLIADHVFLVGSTTCSTQRNWGAHSSLNTFLIFSFFFSLLWWFSKVRHEELEEPSFDFELRVLVKLGAPKVDALMFLAH